MNREIMHRLWQIGVLLLVLTHCINAQVNAPWVPDNGDGTYKNPVLYADYSDPDVVRVDDDYYLVASSFSHFPGLPILHSKDLVNWRIIGHAALTYPYPEFNIPQHGMAIWAPAIRYHGGEYFIYFGDPDRGVFMTKARNPAGPWESLRLIRKVTGWIDTCPFWDDDGEAYLVHAWANSRVGIKSILAINKMNKKGTEILDDGVIVFDGHFNHPTIEGPKLYKRNGYYYIFAPAGGVKQGWQTVLRSKNIYGPYEDRKVLERGSTLVNGPHQGAWVTTQVGEDWFLHFQDRYAYGRIVHLQPMQWENDWPVIGVDYDKNGIGEPVALHKKPTIDGVHPSEVLQTTDEFDAAALGLQWQWEASFDSAWVSLQARKGWLRLSSQKTAIDHKNLWTVPSLMLQKFPGPNFTATTRMQFSSSAVGCRAGLIVFGLDYALIEIEKTKDGYAIVQAECKNADKGSKEEINTVAGTLSADMFFRVEVKLGNQIETTPKAICTFSYSTDGITFRTLGTQFVAREGLWVGAKVGVFCLGVSSVAQQGYVDIDWFRIE